MTKCLFVFLFLLNSTLALAFDDRKIVLVPHSEGVMNNVLRKTTDPAQIFSRTQSVLSHYNIPQDPGYQSELNALFGKQTLEGLNKMLPAFDRTSQFERFSAFQTSSLTFAAFQDRDSRRTLDFTMQLAQVILPERPFSTDRSDSAHPFAGLRIALDPGHMGSQIWDERTGKYVTDHKGHIVSEGVINLQTCLLFKERLEKLGAKVLITRETLAPVTTKTWENLRLADYIPEELESETLEPWFLSLVENSGTGPDLFAAFDHSLHIKKLFSEEMRSDFFILAEDLDARARMIEDFNPQITLIIHYDSAAPAGDPNGVGKVHHDFTKAYVPGGFLPTELASRALRNDFAKHVFNPSWWNESVSLAGSVLSELEKGLNLKPDMGNDGDAVILEPGLQARNLSLTHKLSKTALAYVECLFYNDPTEFAEFLQPTHPMTIGGASYPYSDRLVKVVDALEAGVTRYVKSL